MMLIAVAFVLICRSANPADVARARPHGRPGGADARPAQTAPRGWHASRKDRTAAAHRGHGRADRRGPGCTL
jgi:hypothetical protein